MSEPDRREIRVFIASPGDVADERRAFKEIVDELNKGFGRGANVRFKPLGWEDAPAVVSRRSQGVINRDVDSCDVFVLVMWRRWGQPAPDAAPYSSYTEEEFYRALARYERNGEPTIFVFFKLIDPGQTADPGEQLKQVLAFRGKLEATRKVLYRGFADEKAFRQEIDAHLVKYAKGECEAPAGDRAVPILPDSIMAEIEKYKAEAQRAVDELKLLRAEAARAVGDADEARARAKDAPARAVAAESVTAALDAARALESAQRAAEDAAGAAREGRIGDARRGFAKALDGATDLRVLYLGYEFFKRVGDLDEAERLVNRRIALAGPDSDSTETARAYGNLGVVLDLRGDFERAEAMHRKALAIDERLGNREGMARHYGNLGNVMYHRGQSTEAEAMHRKALAMDESLGNEEGMARHYSNLGNVLRKRGELEAAEAMHAKALAIDEKLDRLEGMASTYGSLGHIRQARGDIEGAREMWTKSRDLFIRFGALHKVPAVQALIDGLPE